jgi:hypothetical protein
MIFSLPLPFEFCDFPDSSQKTPVGAKFSLILPGIRVILTLLHALPQTDNCLQAAKKLAGAGKSPFLGAEMVIFVRAGRVLAEKEKEGVFSLV